MIRTSNDYEWH